MTYIKGLDKKSICVLRTVNHALKARVEECEKMMFTYWRRQFCNVEKLKTFSEDVKTMKGGYFLNTVHTCYH